MKIETYLIRTVMGKLYMSSLPFLSTTEHDEFDQIGYSGETHQKLKMSSEQYLNSLGKGTFQVTQTKYDNGDFTENFTIVRVIN